MSGIADKSIMKSPISVAIISDTKDNGTEGGTATSGAKRTRDINTIDFNPDGFVSLDSNQFTLKPGLYFIRAISSMFLVGESVLYIEDVTNTETIARSLNSCQENRSFKEVWCALDILEETTYEIQHEVQTTRSTDGFGEAITVGATEKYTNVEIFRLQKCSVAIISDTKSNGTGGGASSAGSTETRDLNTVEFDPDSIVSLDSNQFTLQSGRYWIMATSCTVGGAGRTVLYLEDITNTATISRGYSNRSQSSPSQLRSFVDVTGETAYEIQHEFENSNASGKGRVTVIDSDEVYSRVAIIKF